MKIDLLNKCYADSVKTRNDSIKIPAKEPFSLPANTLRYADLTRLAFGSQIAQVKQPLEENPLQEVITSPIYGVEHAKEWPLNIADLKKMYARFKDAQKFNNIDESKTPMLSVYNLTDSGGKIYGVYNILINRVIADEGQVLFEMGKTANVLDEALAHELYHCQRGLYFSKLSDEAVEKAIDKRLDQAISTRNLPIFEIIAGEKIPQFTQDNIKLIVEESKKPLDEDISEVVVDKIHQDLNEYSKDSVNFFIRTLKRQRQMYERNIVIGYEPALKENLFTLKSFEARIPESVYAKMKKFQGMSKEDVVQKFLHEKTHKLVLMGYITPKEAEKARKLRQQIINEAPVTPENQAKLLTELDQIFTMLEAAFIHETLNNHNVDNLNKFKIKEDYMYCQEEINARQHGLLHKMNLLKEKLEKAEGYQKSQITKDLKQAQADYDLNETMLVLKKLIKEKEKLDQVPDELLTKINELTEKATEQAKHAEYTVPKMLGEKHKPYVPFSYGENYVISAE